ncbi:hypothetical protein QKU48_gp1336 [Fadolivirus algeromassiliense]|jgi:hypothetical protein|uniref:Uncharacterized protein n=1 Tax=Fadolivirus FV1/VV64 TaxID=3070911 RepID=A0A7D3UWE6_9VIRU|nr:hypothetical protein QKU48_gp1336 [Fadolivirus algeromassiliense]QKF94794.1 hypothetical protein Fadolivirus_1_1336 [Fadolivirus FV1/VV64]
MINLEKFFVHISDKNGNDNQIEQFCKNILSEKVLSLMKSNRFGGTIDMGNLMQMVYDELLQKKISIVCLMFSDGNKICIDKTKLLNVPYFKNMFDNCNNDNEIIIEIPLIDILDNYIVMNEIICFIHKGETVSQIDPEMFYKIALVDDYLGEIVYCSKQLVQFSLRDYIESRIIHIFRCIDSRSDNKKVIFFKNISEGGLISKKFFDDLYECCIILGYDINSITVNNFFITDKSGFIGSKLHMNLCEKEKNRIHRLFKEYLSLDLSLELRIF